MEYETDLLLSPPPVVIDESVLSVDPVTLDGWRERLRDAESILDAATADSSVPGSNRALLLRIKLAAADEAKRATAEIKRLEMFR